MATADEADPAKKDRDAAKALRFADRYRDPASRTCHQCEGEIPLINVVAGVVKCQSFTGRLFCGDDCWEEYLDQEGL